MSAACLFLSGCGRRESLGDRQDEPEGAAPPFLGLQLDASGVRLGRPLYQRESQSAPAHLARTAAPDTVEALENALSMLGSDAGAFVSHFDESAVPELARRDTDARSLRRILDRVVHEVQEGLPQGEPVPFDEHRPLAVGRERLPAFLGEDGQLT